MEHGFMASRLDHVFKWIPFWASTSFEQYDQGQHVAMALLVCVLRPSIVTVFQWSTSPVASQPLEIGFLFPISLTLASSPFNPRPTAILLKINHTGQEESSAQVKRRLD